MPTCAAPPCALNGTPEMTGARLRSELNSLHAYQPEPALGDAPLDANENPFEPPASFIARVPSILATAALNRYPDPAAAALRERLARLHGLPQASLLFGNGSDELIALLLTAFGGGDALCVVPSPAFSMYRLCALGQGWQVQELELDAGFDLDQAFVERVRELRPRLVFLASPNNPTGNALAPGMVDKLRGLPGTTLVLDEAYAEFGGRSLLSHAPREEGLVVLRTFSKAWGLAGLRLGYLCARPDLVAELEKLRLPYNLNVLTQALACAALDDAPAFMARVPQLLALRQRLEQGLRTLPGAEVYASDANFVLLRCPQALALHAALLDGGLRVRRFGAGRLQGCLRISVGTPQQQQRLEAILADFIKGASAP
jgi:histidinol-phosphate aminotransferase